MDFERNVRIYVLKVAIAYFQHKTGTHINYRAGAACYTGLMSGRCGGGYH